MTTLLQQLLALTEGATKGYDTSEQNRTHYDNFAEWEKVLRQDGGDTFKKNATVIGGMGHDGEVGEFDKAKNKGWLITSYRPANYKASANKGVVSEAQGDHADIAKEISSKHSYSTLSHRGGTSEVSTDHQTALAAKAAFTISTNALERAGFTYVGHSGTAVSKGMSRTYKNSNGITAQVEVSSSTNKEHYHKTVIKGIVSEALSWRFAEIIEKIKKLDTRDNPWELYTDGGGYKAANKELTRALLQAIMKKTTKEAWAVMTPVFKKHSKIGGYDSEPVNLAEYWLQRAFDEKRHDEI